MLVSNIGQILLLKTFKICYKEAYGTITSENLEYSDKLVAMVTSDNLGNQK